MTIKNLTENWGLKNLDSKADRIATSWYFLGLDLQKRIIGRCFYSIVGEPNGGHDHD